MALALSVPVAAPVQGHPGCPGRCLGWDKRNRTRGNSMVRLKGKTVSDAMLTITPQR